MSVAMDGHSQAHMDVLVAFFGRATPHRQPRMQQARAGARTTTQDVVKKRNAKEKAIKNPLTQRISGLSE
ncbi:MAG: hypothetical protein CMG91_11820 [Marinobacter sp.]|nr:hypothetical protein [Marinobacter sp.]